MRKNGDFAVAAVFGGAITQLVSGLLLVGIAEMGDGDLNHIKIGVKLVAEAGVGERPAECEVVEDLGAHGIERISGERVKPQGEAVASRTLGF